VSAAERRPVLHLLKRGRILAAAALAALLWAVLHRLPDRTEGGVAGMLAAEATVLVAPDDFVWEPSSGAFADLFRGRGVVFLARSADGSPRDVFRGRVHVTIGGQPVAARGTRRLTHTPLGDEESLTIVGERALFATRFEGKVQSIGVIDLEQDRARRVALSAPVDAVSWEAASDALVLALPAGAAALSWDAEPAAAAAPAARWAEEGEPADAASAPAEVFTPPAQATAEVFPPAGASPLVAGEQAAVFEVAATAGRTIALDGRQLELHLVDGASTPGTQTGWVTGGSIPRSLVERGIVAAIALPSVGGAGSFHGGAWAAPIPKSAAAVGISTAGRLYVGAWPFEPWQSPELDSANELRWLSPGAGDHSSAWWMCATNGGHVMVGMGRAAADGSQWSHCASGVTGAGAFELLGVEGGAVDWSSLRLAGPTLIAVRAPYGPSVAAPSDKWSTVALGQPTPAWMPAVRATRTTVLGAEVEITWIDPARFDWTLRAGTDERSHRLGGDFPETLAPADATRVRLAVGLGVGKRRSPRGLRIDGSIGHRFHGSEGLLLVGPGRLEIHGADRPGVEPRDDGTELPVTVEEGELTQDARKRGPRQLRADLCLVPGGALLAQATFDNHEATATALRDLGCRLALALDRGSDRESWTATERPGPFETTALIGLDRPLKGRAEGMPAAVSR
jgi:hypothetical protein